MFQRLADRVTSLVGTWQATIIAFLSVIIWAILGPPFKFSEGWQLTINTGTTIITFLMVFLIQSSQNQDTKRLHMKIDELIRAIDEADDSLRDTAEDKREQ